MNTAQAEQKAFAWLKQIPGDLFTLDEKPLLGIVPEFPWDEFTSEVNSTLQLKELSIEVKDWRWLARQELFTGLGSDLRGISFNIPPLPGTLWIVMSEQDIVYLMKKLLIKDDSKLADDIDTDFINAFYRFMALETLTAFEKVHTDKNLAINLARDESLPTEDCLCLDLTIQLSPKSLYTRLFLTPEFHKAWRQKHLQPDSKLMLSSPMADKLDVVVHLEAGRVNIKPSEWDKISPGDFLVLDSCSLNPDEDGGRVSLVINDIPYFRGRLKNGNLKISENPLYTEVNTVMDQPDEPDEFSDFDHTDSDFDFGDEHSETPTPSVEEDFEIEGEVPATPAMPVVKTSVKVPAAPAAAKPAARGPSSLEDLPLPLAIEVGRIQMSIKKLLELQPGNMLELDIHPEAGVDLVVHGKRVARGELLRIGDTLGVRILEL